MPFTNLLGKCQQFGLAREEEQRGGILQWQAFIRCFLTARNLVPSHCFQYTLYADSQFHTYLMVPIRESTKNLYSSVGASSLAFHTLL